MACCASRSTTVGIPKRRFLPLPLGISTLRTELGRYVPFCKELIISSLLAKNHGNSCSHDILSIPPHPLLLTTALCALFRLEELRMHSNRCSLSNGTSTILSSVIYIKACAPSYHSDSD